MQPSTGFDKTTAAIVRLEEKVSRLEEDFRELKAEMKEELSDIKNMLNTLTLHMSQNEATDKNNKMWLGTLAAIVSCAVSIGAKLLMRIFIR